MTLMKVIDPKTHEVKVVLDTEDKGNCLASMGGLPMNEACGGCDKCLLMQCHHWGFIIEEAKCGE